MVAARPARMPHFYNSYGSSADRLLGVGVLPEAAGLLPANIGCQMRSQKPLTLAFADSNLLSDSRCHFDATYVALGIEPSL